MIKDWPFNRYIRLSMAGIVMLLLMAGSHAGLAAPDPVEQVPGQAALGSAFSYQGHLRSGSLPAVGSFDFQFKLFDADSAGIQLGQTNLREDVLVENGLFTVWLDFGSTPFNGGELWLEVGVRPGESVDAFILLSPRQHISPAPYALGLRPGAVVSGAVSGGAITLGNLTGDGLVVTGAGSPSSSAASPASNGLEVNGAAGSGIFIGRADGAGVQVQSAGGNGLQVGTSSGSGLSIESALLKGIQVSSAGQEGIAVQTAGGAGVLVGAAGAAGVSVSTAATDGIYIGRSGSASKNFPSSSNNGIEVAGAGGHGIYVGWADKDGILISEAQLTGISVGATGGTGIRVDHAGENGITVTSANANGIDVQGNQWAGYFRGNVYINGTCSGCKLAAFAVNTGEAPLQPGDIVTIQGTRQSPVSGDPLLMEVSLAQPGQAVVGVVQGPAEVVTSSGEQRFSPLAGSAQPGSYVTVVIFGPAQVRVGAVEAVLAPGTRLAAGSAGAARALRTVQVEGVPLAESAPTLGILLEVLQPGNTLAWVLVNPQ